MTFFIAFPDSKFMFYTTGALSRFREGVQTWNFWAMYDVSEVMSII